MTTTAFRLSPAPPPTTATAPVADAADAPTPTTEATTRATTQATPSAESGALAEAGFTLSPPPAGVTDEVAPVTAEATSPAPVPDPAEAPGAAEAPTATPQSVQAVDSVAVHDPAYAQEPDRSPVSFAPPPQRPPAVPLSNEEAFRVASAVAAAWSGEQLYAAVSPDVEYVTDGHGAQGSRHFGLGFGLLLFTQESGLLGEVLRLFHERDAAAFAQAFGGEAEALLATTTAPTAPARLAPVGGALLWDADWPARFAAAGALAPCRYAQNEVAVERVVRPAAAAAVQLGLDTDRGVATAADLVTAGGVGAGLQTLVGLAAPYSSLDQARAAMRALGYADVPALQAASGVPRTGVLDAPTVAALMAAARRSGADPATAGELAARVLARSRGPARRRLEALHRTPDLDDRVLSVPA